MTSLDRLSPLLDRFRVRTRVFHTGPLCGVTAFAAQPGRGFLHVLRRGEMEVTHRGADGRPERRAIDRPSLLFYPRPLEHSFHNAPTEDSDFACATLDFDGGATHPLVRTLPAVIVLPLAAVDSLEPSLDLLFAEIDNVRCGRRVLADRLFEVVLVHLFRWLLDHTEELALPAGLLTGLADERIARTLVAVHETPGGPWTLATMAREAHMSRSAFAARFKSVVGQSPAEYVTGWRLTVAQERLRGGASVARTATELGYANPPAFSRAFARELGQSPRAWLAGAR
ncbi:AraC family transcriptional regulator [Nocardiopsis sp. NRRL B-16309]|uniref:AraC family transcriptional regulator n=1 Tax=Nocardiopsis sp. NRRL B-16309 TaxID=1519494 RepID=UPI0006AE5C99|nr:AraC family transcriptional regulator [Nocardiopsis sp. NRRL B-16309]